MISLQTNVNDLILQRTLYENTFGLDSTIERMSTGLRINQARDNAAGVSIQTDLNRRISSLLQTKANTEDGISLLQTAEGGLAEMKKLLSRLRELTIQASDGVYDLDLRAKMQEEADQIVEELERLKKSINYDGRNIYEASSNNPVTTAVDNLADAVVINNLTTNPNTLLQQTLNNVSEVVQTTSDTSSFAPMSYSTPRMMSSNLNDGIALMSLDDGVSPASTTIEGAVDLAASETQTIMIDGVQYTIINNLTTTNSLSYIKDTTTGQITFSGNDFTITGQSDVAHNLVINGQRVTIRGGDKNDILESTSGSRGCVLEGYGGNDTIVKYDHAGRADGGDGDDTITLYGKESTIYGGAGNDNLTIRGTADNVLGGAGNDIINVYNANNNIAKIKGDDGDDIFNIYSGAAGLVIDGGAGTNTVETDNVAGVYKVNVVNSNANVIDFNANETKTVTINNIDYTITNRNSTATSLVYNIDNNQIEFLSRNFKIVGDTNVAHNVKISASQVDFYGGDKNDTIILNQSGVNVYANGGDDDIILQGDWWNQFIDAGAGNDVITGSNLLRSRLFTGDGDDSVDITSMRSSYIDTGADNDSVKLNNYTPNGNVIYGGTGTNTISGDIGTNQVAGFGDSDNAQAIVLQQGETKTVDIGKVTFDITNKAGTDYSRAFLYSYDNNSQKYIFGCYDINLVTKETLVDLDVTLYGRQATVKLGSGNDTVKSYGTNMQIYTYNGNDNVINYNNDNVYCTGNGDDYLESNNAFSTLKGESGNDTIVVNTAQTALNIYGGEGDDTYYINAKVPISDTAGNNIFYVNSSNANITAGTGNDTFYITGSSNTISGAAGDDYFVVEGSDNTLDGGTGTNYYVDTGSNNTYTNVVTDPNSGTITFSYTGQVLTREIGGKNYTFTNNGAANNSLSYAVNQNTGEVILTCSDVTVLGADDESHNLVIKGSNNIVNGGNLADRIVVEQGSDNTLNGNGGNDTLINNDVNNSINGGDGDDTITLNSSTNLAVTGGAGADVLEVVSNNNTNVSGGAGDDRVSVNGTNNTVKADDGNNVITINGNSNTVSATTGNNRLLVNSSDNTVNLGSGANTYGISGNNNNVTIQNATGNVSISGTNNTITQVGGNSNVSITGTLNNYSSTLGAKNIDVYGDGNTVITGNENDVIEIQGNSNSFQSAGGSNKIEVKGNNNQIQGGNGVDTIKLNGLRNTALGGDGNDAFTVISGDENTIDGEGGDRNTIVNRSKTTIHSNAIDITPKGFELKVKVDIGSGDNKYINTTIGFDLMGLDVDFSTQEKALDSLELIDELIKNIDSEMLHIGMTINRLESVMEEQTIRINNMISSRSTLCDADIAEESSKYLRYQILQNAAATLLASSRNLRAENVLGLLEGLNR